MYQRKRGERAQSVKSKSQREIENVVKERKLRKQWKKATEEEREGNDVLQEELRSRLAALRKPERFRKKKRKKEYIRRAFFGTFNFVKGLFKRKEGSLKQQSFKAGMRERIDNSERPGKLKLQCLQFGLLSTPYILKIALLLFHFSLFSFWLVIVQKKEKNLDINRAIVTE